MIPLTFSRAIPLFFVTQTLLFLLLLTASDKKANNNGLRIPGKIQSLIASFLYMILVLGNALTILGGFRYSFAYNIVVTTTPAILILLLATTPLPKRLFALMLLWHTMLLGLEAPLDMLSITEGVHMTRTMAIYGRWIPELAHNPSYNPFPTMAFIRTALSYVTGIPWFHWFLAFAILIVVALAFDLAVLTLTLKITSDYRIALLAVIVGALTPYLLVTGHAYQVPANIMWLLSVSLLIKALRAYKKSDIIPIALLYLSSILTHTTAYIVMVFPLILVLANRLIKSDQNIREGYSRLMKIVIPTFLVMGIFRVVYEELYVRYIYKIGYGGVLELVNKIFAILIGKESLEDFKFSLYDFGGIPFYQAFLWALTASLASAALLYCVIKRRALNVILFTFFLTASLFIALGYLQATFVKITTQQYRSVYVSFSLLVPLAAIAVGKIISSRNKYLIVVVLAVFVVSSFLALRDPEISTIYRLKARGIPPEVLYMQPTQGDITKANIIIDSVKDVNIINFLAFYSSPSVRFERLTTCGRRIPMTYTKLTDAIYKLLYIYGYTVSDLPIVNINVVEPGKVGEDITLKSLMLNFGEDLVFTP